jgi:hypothetical protein
VVALATRRGEQKARGGQQSGSEMGGADEGAMEEGGRVLIVGGDSQMNKITLALGRVPSRSSTSRSPTQP